MLPRDEAPTERPRWSRADLLFLIDARRRGLSDALVAGFLCRTEDEVRQKAKELMRQD